MAKTQAGPESPVMEYTVETKKPFDEAVRAIEQAASERGFRVLHTHDVAADLAEKGFVREPLKIIEICNARFANEVLSKEIRAALMLPCPITVYQREGKIFLSTLLPAVIASFYPEAGIESVASEVQKIVVEIVDQAKG
jgi:uncharacterized protein (DUF302 family)